MSTGSDLPAVKNVLVDEENDVRYEVLAYRALSEEELLFAVRYSLASGRPKRKPKCGSVVRLVTLIGHGDE